jgi:hypothetical protein
MPRPASPSAPDSVPSTTPGADPAPESSSATALPDISPVASSSPRRRGRPSSGSAVPAAARQRQWRERLEASGLVHVGAWVPRAQAGAIREVLTRAETGATVPSRKAVAVLEARIAELKVACAELERHNAELRRHAEAAEARARSARTDQLKAEKAHGQAVRRQEQILSLRDTVHEVRVKQLDEALSAARSQIEVYHARVLAAENQGLLGRLFLGRRD